MAKGDRSEKRSPLLLFGEIDLSFIHSLYNGDRRLLLWLRLHSGRNERNVLLNPIIHDGLYVNAFGCCQMT